MSLSLRSKSTTAVIICAFLSFAPAHSVRAGERGVATCLSVRGALLSRADDQDWETVKPNQPVKSGAVLMSLFEAHLLTANNAIEIEMYGDIGTHGDFPVFESAIRLRPTTIADLDLSLLRGTVTLSNRKFGTARVILRLGTEAVTFDLQGAGAKVALTATGRHAPGAASAARDLPTTFLFAVVLQGKATVAGKLKQMALSAPPGPALVQWDSLDKTPEVTSVPKLPPAPAEAEKAEFKAMCRAAVNLNNADRIGAAVTLIQSPQELDRLVGVTALGALDALPQLLVALNDPKHADVRRQGILVLRHWLGREPGQLKKFQNVLITEKKLNAAKVKSAMSLLLGFDDAERAQPTTYDFLIDCLKYKTIAVRELAHWHLVRLAPAGKDIPFNAALPPEEQEQTVQRWRALIPPGQVPRQSKTSK